MRLFRVTSGAGGLEVHPFWVTLGAGGEQVHPFGEQNVDPVQRNVDVTQ